MEKRLLKGVIFSFISALSFASLAVLIRVGYNLGLGTFDMLFFRFFFAVFLMGLFFVLFKKETIKPTKRLILKSFFTGAVLYASMAFCFFKAIRYTSPNVVELLLYLYPATVTVIVHFAFRDRLNFYKFVYIAVILTGFAFIFNDAFSSRIHILGVAFGVSAMLVYSFYLVAVELLVKGENPVAFSFYTIFFAFLSFFLIAMRNGIHIATLSQIGIGILLGLVPTFLAIMFLFLAIDYVGSALTSVFSSVEPIFTIIMSFLILNIGLNSLQLTGGLFIIAGVFMANIYHAKRGLRG